MGQPLYCSTADDGMWGERETMVMVPPPTGDSEIKYNRLTQRTKGTKNCIYQLRTKLTKAQTGKQN